MRAADFTTALRPRAKLDSTRPARTGSVFHRPSTPSWETAMPPLHGLDAVKTLLLRRGVHPDYVTRLLNELIDHRHDLIEDLVSSGVEAQIAQGEADRRMGSAEIVADAVLAGRCS